MKLAVISDIHSNLEALNAVLDDIKKRNVDEIICLGDIVGYGPNPNECIDLIKSISNKIVLGNHDSAVVNQTDVLLFNAYAREATEWTKRVITDENYEFLLGLPLKIKMDKLMFVHSTPLIPEDWNYILTQYGAEKQFNYFSENICFIGHTHRPDVFASIDGRKIINVGSVGQPRDGNPDSSYLIYDTEVKEYTFLRVKYDIEKVVEKIKKIGLNDFLGERLLLGR